MADGTDKDTGDYLGYGVYADTLWNRIPQRLGLCDLSGNLWEWQNNLYQPSGKGQEKGLNELVTTLKIHEKLDPSDAPTPRRPGAPALRGGAWYDSAVDAPMTLGYTPSWCIGSPWKTPWSTTSW